MNGITYELYDATMTATIKDGGCSGIVYVDETFRMMQNSYTVTAVADNAFMGNSSITEVMLPNTVKTIGASAFDGCTSLQRINIPRNLESIGSDAFDRCEALQPIQLIQADPGAIPSDDDLQQAMTHWLSIRFGSDRANPLFYAHRLTGMSEEDIVTEVNIPESITEIYAWAFAGGQDITTVNFPNPSDEAKALSKAKSAADQEFKIGYGAFYGCEKLVISKLPASVKEIKPSTFEGCRSIVEFNVHEGIRAVGSRAFAGCIGLKEFFCLTSYVPEAQGDTFEDSSVDEATLYVSTGMVEEFSDAEGWNDFGNIEIYISEEERAELLATDFFAMTAVNGDTEVSMEKIDPSYFRGEIPIDDVPIYIQVSFDKLNWTAPIKCEDKDGVKLVTIPSGKTAYFRRSGDVDDTMHNCQFFWDGKVDLSGNIMSLLDEKCKTMKLGKAAFVELFGNEGRFANDVRNASDLKLPATELADYCYAGMFIRSNGLITTPELPATKLAECCYMDMFGYTSITTVPELPATELEVRCYASMFTNCTKLTTARILPAKTLATSCYSRMFNGCESLTEAPELPATTLADNCYSSMFSSSGLTTTPELPATELADNCCNMMFYRCKDLTTAKELPATTLAKSCYSSMFAGCENLITPPVLPATELASACYYKMFSECGNLITAPELPATELADNCYAWMFNECTNLATAPELPATTLAKSCYSSMFRDCKNLITPPALPATELADYCYDTMFYDSGLTTAPELPATELLAPGCCRYMYNYCKNLDALTIKAEDYEASSVYGLLKNTKHVFTLTCPQTLIDKKGMAKIKEDFGLLPDDNIVALEVIESAILDDENHTAWLRHGTRGGKRNNGDDDPDSPGYRGHRLTFPDKITVDGEDYEVVGISPEAFDDLEGVKEIVIECSRVPEIAPDAFDGKDVSGITLFVPEELVDDYRNTEPWARFWPNIIPIREHVTTPQGEFIINNVDETADMISGGRPEDRPSVIVIPATVEHDGRTYPVTKVEPEVFADLSGIEEIFIHAEIVPYLDPHALDDKDLSGIILYVPDDLVEEYQNTYPWSLFPDIRPISEAGIETVTVGSAPVNMKYIENRRIVIRHNGKKYSVQGTLLR